jgi:hypothetical protein
MRVKPGMVKVSPMPNEMLNRFHAWLIRQRQWCDRCSDLTPAVTVRRFNGAETVLCLKHASRLDAVRESEEKQTPNYAKHP